MSKIITNMIEHLIFISDNSLESFIYIDSLKQPYGGGTVVSIFKLEHREIKQLA